MTLFKFLPPRLSHTVVTLFLLLVTSYSWSQQKLILIGGGPGRPKEALKQFGDWAKQENGTILIITWASEIPAEVGDELMEDFSTQFKGLYARSTTIPETPAEQAYFLKQLSYVTGVFFSGGDQNKTMSALNRPGGQVLREALIAAYNSGVVFGGTSAGTAIMSRLMISGNIQKDGRVPISEGLGLLPSTVIVDQHFSQRTRKARLMRAHVESGTIAGIGIDEDTALIITDNYNMRVSGAHTVRIFFGVEDHHTEWTLKDGDELTVPLPK